MSRSLNGAVSECDLVAQVVQDRRIAGYLYDPVAGNFEADGGRTRISNAALRAMAATLGQEITFDRGRVVQSNYHDYTLLRNAKIPSIQIEFLKTDYPLTGLGEPAYPSALPAFCNAIYAASGRRVRKLPISAAKLKA